MVPDLNRLVSIDALTTADLPADWRAVLTQPEAKTALGVVREGLVNALAQGTPIYPAQPWRALHLTPLSEVKVLILGQDPYHGPGQAQGLAFSVASGSKTPPSLRNIFAEIDRDLGPISTGLRTPANNDLGRWARQGVLLLNTVLTVEDGRPASHAKLGWQAVTDRLIDAVIDRQTPTVYMLWGSHAQEKRQRIQARGNGASSLVLQANHPSPLSARRGPAPFIGCGHFSQANQWLASRALSPIDW